MSKAILLIVLLFVVPSIIDSYVKFAKNIEQRFKIKNNAFKYDDEDRVYSSVPLSMKEVVNRNTVKLISIFKIAPFLFISSAGLPKNVFAGSMNEDSFINSLATMIEAKKVIEPTNKFVTVQAYDNARTNIQFILNQLQLQKKLTVLIQNSIDFSDNIDAIESAQEAGNRLTNTAIQYDSTVYTIIFIPSDDGQVPPSAEKYRKQCTTFYKSFNDDIDAILKVANEQQLEKANIIAEKNLKSYPTVLFKDSKLKQTGI